MQNLSSIAYPEFVRAVCAGSAKVWVNKHLASRVMASSLMPKDYRLAYRLWTWVWLSLVPVAMLVGGSYSWAWTPLIVAALCAAQLFTRSKTASTFVIDYSKEDELFYDIMVQLGVMRVSVRQDKKARLCGLEAIG